VATLWSEEDSIVAYPEVLTRLIEQLKKLPGVGSRTAERLALAIAGYRTQEALELAEAIGDVARGLRCCSVCFNTSESDPCRICSAAGREKDRILVVENPGDLNAFEEAGWNGLYHVLQGKLDPVEGVLPEHLTVGELKERVMAEEIAEIVIATSPDYEGDGTALAILDALKETGVPVSRIARGIQTGGSIEYANRAVLRDALDGRNALQR
jgi:recombination protein RecR